MKMAFEIYLFIDVAWAGADVNEYRRVRRLSWSHRRHLFIEKFFHATTFFGGRVLQGKRPRRQIQFPAKGPQLRAKTITNSYVDIAKFLGAAK